MGRPTGESGNQLLEHIKTLAPPSLLPDEDQAPSYDPTQAYGPHLCCPVCWTVLDRPVELSCGAVICLDCCCRWIQVAQHLSCPCCYSHSLSSTSLQKPSRFLIALLEDLPVICSRGCGKVVKLLEYKSHLQGKCKSHYHQDLNSPSRMTLSDVLARPTSTPSTPGEAQVTEHLVRRLFPQDRSSTEAAIAQVKTRGQVSSTAKD